MRCWAHVVAIGLWVWVLSGVAAPAPCAARSRGIAAQGCSGCHVGGAEPEARLIAMGEAVPGQPLRLLLEIEAANGPVAGFYLSADVPGTLRPVAGQGTQAFGDGIAHASPKQGSGFVRFEVDWIAPADPAGVVFEVWVVSANDNDRSSGDGASSTRLSLAAGCEGELYFRDADRDGYGSEAFGTRIDCEPREGYTTVEGDCDENDPEINPSAGEYCNERDDDCDGMADEGSMPQAHYPDPDGDGHGEPGGESVLECPPPRGFAPSNDDCLEGDATAHPGAMEVCDGHDNDCDNQADERVKPACGLGWCRRESWSCSIDDCMPGEPRPEECNAFDDDCDDVLDEGVDCGAGLVCQEGYCIAEIPGEPVQGSGGDGPSTAGQGGSTSGHSGSDAQAPVDIDAGSTAARASNAGGCSLTAASARTGWELVAACAVTLWLARRRRLG